MMWERRGGVDIDFGPYTPVYEPEVELSIEMRVIFLEQEGPREPPGL